VFRSHRLTIALLLVVAIARRCAAQGGPPMITDDPGTPGNRKWEINLAVALEHRLGETSLDLPAIDLNYGVGENFVGVWDPITRLARSITQDRAARFAKCRPLISVLAAKGDFLV
jgi:hypothetical protein